MCNLTYDSRNRLISAGNVTYDYDAENTRISVTTTDKKITYVTDVAGEMSQVLESYEKTNDGKKIHTVYVYGNGLIYSYNDNEADSTTSDNKVQDLSSDKSSDKDTDGTTYYHYNNIGSTTKLTDNNGNVIQSYEYGAYGEVLSGDTKITPFLYNGQLGVMTDDNGLYYMRARYYNVNIKRFINQDVVHGSINVSQSLNRYSYVQGNPIKLTDPFGLSPLDRLNWKNLGHAILNGLGLIPVIGEAFDIANAIWYAHDGEYGMAVLSMMSALPMIGNIASGIMTAAKITTAAKIVSTVCKVVSNAATFTQAAIGGVNNAKAIVKNMINGKLFSEDTAKNLVSFGINAFTAATSGKNLLSSSKELKKVVGDSVGSKWDKKAKKEPLLECNLQFFADKSGGKTGKLTIIDGENYSTSEINAAQYMASLENDVVLRPPVGTRAGGQTSDLLVNGINYDVYTPTTSNPSAIIRAITKKNTQTTGVVLDLSSTTVTVDDLGNILGRVRGAIEKNGGICNINDIVVMPK